MGAGAGVGTISEVVIKVLRAEDWERVGWAPTLSMKRQSSFSLWDKKISENLELKAPVFFIVED